MTQSPSTLAAIQRDYDNQLPDESPAFDESGSIERDLRDNIHIRVFPQYPSTWGWELYSCKPCAKYRTTNKYGITLPTDHVDEGDGCDSLMEAAGDAESALERYVTAEL